MHCRSAVEWSPMAKGGMLGEISPQPRAQLRSRWSAASKITTPTALFKDIQHTAYLPR